MSFLKAACVQMNAGPDVSENLKTAETFVREAAGQGAQFVVTPEHTCHVRFPAEGMLESAFSQDEHPGVSFFSDLARELGVWLLIGSMAVKVSEDKLLNRSFLFSDQGDLVATYDKIHLFDVALPTGEVHRESDLIKPGEMAVVASTPWAKVGMSICYDVRFPHLYRDLAKAGASILAVPAAFTVPTGRAHWEILLRARAIETGSFVMASAQTGEHEGGRRTWGHSMIINPWGEVLAVAESEPGVILAELNLGAVAKTRRTIPALQHDRLYEVIPASSEALAKKD